MENSNLNFIIKTLKGETNPIDIEWFETLGFLYTHRVAGLFYNRAKQLNIELPQKVEKLLKEVFNKQKRRVGFLREYLKEISKELINENIEHVFLKGSIFPNVESLGIYVEGERSSNDIDILVKSEGITLVSNVLKKLGYIQGRYDEESNTIIPFTRLEIVSRRMNRGEVAPFIKLTNNIEIPFIEVDINFSLGNTPNDGIELLNKMIDERLLHQGEINLYSLDNEMFFIHLIMHQYKESCLYFMVERSKDLDLYKMADIYYLLKQEKIDMKKIEKISKIFNLEEKIGYVLYQVAEIFDDKEIMNYAKKYKIKEPIVINYENNQKYRFAVGVSSRIKCFNNLSFLIAFEKLKGVDIK